MLRTRSAKVQNGGAMHDWGDIRHFLAVAETGSTLAAGRALRVSQTTVARRITALEAALSLVLFERRQAGYLLTPAGEALVGQARAAEEAMRRLGDEAALLGRTAGGAVRLTMSPIFAFTFMAPIIRDLRVAHPEIRIEVDTSEEVRDLAGGEADVALRVSKQPTGAGLVCRRLTHDPWTVYCSRTYAEQHGVPRRIEELARAPFIGGGEPEVWAQYQQWLIEHGLEGQVVMHHNSSTGLLAAVRAGMGLAVLPCLAADGDPDLVRCLPPLDGVTVSLWLVYHERFRHEPRIRAVLDFLAPRIPRYAS
ncbi:LysR family transcriptional regulator [Sphingomonas sp.]|uniref:LysR family transcriptional regulator n=2 Tax=unclassified Sphingomonas TaxID=196159 RepID=UPI0025FF4EDD|nr:LysR family transcriptional regulator [Sphingomonas sp.]